MTIETIEVLSCFRRRLVLRLAAAGLLASVLAGIAAFFIETERLDDTLVDQATLEARHLGDMVAERNGGSAIGAMLGTFLGGHAATSRDFFVLAEIYDNQRRSLGDMTLPNFAFVEDRFDRKPHPFPAAGSNWYAKTIIHGVPYFQVMVPLGGSQGGWFEGIYRLSPETQEGIRIDILRIVALVVGAVLLTAITLYPLMSVLQGHIVAAARSLLRANIDTLRVLGNAIAKRDSDTNAHNYRVSLYAVRIAEALGLSEAAIRSLIKGAFLHDVGKIAVPDAILLKPGKLDQDEYERMKSHVPHGLDIISSSSWLVDAAEVVGGHHEKVDGSGYPRGLSGDDIPLAARIFAVADVYDALTSTRPYKKPMSAEAAMAILEDGRGRHFDSGVLDAFASLMPGVHAEVSESDDRGVELIAARIARQYFRL